jgi:hypothetical protein
VHTVQVFSIVRVWSTEVVVAASAPTIRPLNEPVTGVTQPGVRLFVVTSEGRFGGCTFATGEVLVCRGEARSADLTVLVARGHGRPRLGSVVGTRLVGDAGEPCLPERWQAAGKLVARYRHAAHGWVVELLDGGAGDLPAAGARVGAGEAPARAEASAQLSLFAA